MDFGDILDQWERSNKKNKPSGKGTPKKVEPVPREKDEPQPELKKVDPLTAWIRRYGVEDKDAAGEHHQAGTAERRQRLLRKKPDMTVDLHGLCRDEAWEVLDAFFQEARRRGFEKILIIHGKGIHSSGDAVLKRAVRDFIERCPFAGESGPGGTSQGGAGTTWVLLKDRKNTGTSKNPGF